MSRFYEQEQYVDQSLQRPSMDLRDEFVKSKNPLVDAPKPPRLVDSKLICDASSLAKLFCDSVYEFRTCRKELEDGACRLERLGRIGMLVNKMRARQMVLDFAPDDSSNDDENSEKTEISD